MASGKLSEAYWTQLLSKTPTILSSHALHTVPLPADIALTIDHTLLAPAATTAEIAEVCEQAKTHGFYSVCVNSSHAKQVVESGVKACVVVGFPLGAMSTEGKELSVYTYMFLLGGWVANTDGNTVRQRPQSPTAPQKSTPFFPSAC